MKYDEFRRLNASENLRDMYNNYQWACILRLVDGRKLSAADRRTLKAIDIINHEEDSLTITGRVVVGKVTARRTRKNKKKKRGKEFAWQRDEQEISTK